MKTKSYLFLFFLLSVLLFIVGVRYGQRVEKTNKNIENVLKIPTSTPKNVAPLIFLTLENKNCGIKLLYPDSFQKTDVSSSSGALKEDGENVFQFNCDQKNPIKTLFEDKTIATTTSQLQNKLISVKIKDNNVILYVKNPKNLKNIYMEVKNSFFPLLNKSLEFNN